MSGLIVRAASARLLGDGGGLQSAGPLSTEAL